MQSFMYGNVFRQFRDTTDGDFNEPVTSPQTWDITDLVGCDAVRTAGGAATTSLIKVSDGPTKEYAVCMEYLNTAANVMRMSQSVMIESEGASQGSRLGAIQSNDPLCNRGSRYKPYFGENMVDTGCAWNTNGRAPWDLGGAGAANPQPAQTRQLRWQSG